MTGFSHSRRLVVEWGHCDPAGIVFNPRFFEYFDYSTALLLETALGAKKVIWTQTYGIIGIPLVDAHARFLAPARFGDEVEITSTVLKVGRASFSVGHTLRNGPALSVEGEETRVWAVSDPDDPAKLKGAPIPDDVRARLLPG